MSQLTSSGFKRILLDVSPKFRDRVEKAKKRYGYGSMREMIQAMLEEGFALRDEMKAGDQLFIRRRDGTEDVKLIIPLRRK